jgi:hypothetical protein
MHAIICEQLCEDNGPRINKKKAKKAKAKAWKGKGAKKRKKSV